MVRIGFFGPRDSYLYSIGKSVEEEVDPLLAKIFFLTDDESFTVDYLVALEEDLKTMNLDAEVCYIGLTMNKKREEAIFLYQRKDILKKQLLEIMLPRGNTKLKIVSFTTLLKPDLTFSFAFLGSHLLANSNKKVCFLSTNDSFPYSKAFPITTKGGLSKLFYWMRQEEEVKDNILSYHHQYGFYFITPTLEPEEMLCFHKEELLTLKGFLEEEGFEYLVLDLGSSYQSLWGEAAKNFCLVGGDSEFSKVLEEEKIKSLVGMKNLEVVPWSRNEGGDGLIIGLDQISLRESRKEWDFWSKKLELLF